MGISWRYDGHIYLKWWQQVFYAPADVRQKVTRLPAGRHTAVSVIWGKPNPAIFEAASYQITGS